MEGVFVGLLLLALVTCFISVIGFIVKWIMKKPKKKWGIVALSAFVAFWGIGILWGVLAGSYKAETADSDAVETSETMQAETEETAPAIDFAEIYKAYKENELRANDTYQFNRYQITAKVNGMKTGGLLNLTGGATLTMEVRVDNTIVFFYAEFEKSQEEALKQINVGDTITFKGKCLSAGSWTDCELIQ